MLEFSFNEVSGLETCNFIKKMTPAKAFSREVVKKIYFVEYLQTTASELVRYKVYIFLSEVCLMEEEEYENYLRITPECHYKLFPLSQVIFTFENYKYERCNHTKTIAFRRNILCSITCSLIFLIFSSYVTI